VEFSARSVITPDPNISVAELGVPLKIAMNLTHPERVTAFNIDRLYALIQNGPDKYPGAKTIVRAADGRMISLKHVNAKEIQLYSGDIVNRHIMDGDIVLFNRQPSLHRMSMMGHRAKVLPYNTFRLNVSVTAPYNADFDGDEMNAHIPQSIEAAIELREIAAVPLQIVGPRESKPIVSVVQDTLVGVNRFTRPNMLFNRREAMNLLVWAQRWDGHLPAPAITDPHPLWSGAQLLSTLLPPVNLEMRNISFDDAKDNFDSPNFVKIHNGIIKQGILDKDVFSKALIHVIYNDYGHEVTVDFLDSLQRMMANFLMNSGFSVGISDLIADEDTKGKIENELSVLKGQIEDILLQVHTGLFDNSSGRSNHEEFESKIFATLNKVIDRAGKEGRNSLSDDNRMTNMIKAGSKGSNTNVAQMIAVLGQQNVEGKRIPYGFQDRTLPHFKRFDDGAAARGFIESSFVKGLTPHEFFFHAMSGREGLIDTAVKTADTGYMQRQLVKAMEDLTIQHDGSVRDAVGNIIQFAYGEDSIICTKIESQPLNLGAMTDAQIKEQFAVPGAPAPVQQAYIEAVLEDRRMLVERVFRSRLEKADKQNVYYPVHLDRLIHTVARQFEFTGKETPVTGEYIIQVQASIVARTAPRNRLWQALLRLQLLAHAKGNEAFGDDGDFLERQQPVARQEGHLLRHAIAAAEIAAIRHRNAQVADRSAEAVDQCGVGRRFSHIGTAKACRAGEQGFVHGCCNDDI
jgi:DNA-directed RNA polymerase II subunit RPB1